MLENVRNFFRYRYLMWMWVVREIKIRYKQSVLGTAWAIIQPLSLMVIFTVVFSYFVRIPTGDVPYSVFAYTGLLPWTFLATTISFGALSLVGNMDLLTKIYFPREILPLAPLCASMLDFLLGFIFFAFLLFIYRIPLSATTLWLPIIILVQVILLAGIVLLVSATNVFYRDIKYVLPLLIQLWFYATPIIYPMSVVPEWLRPFYVLNPMAGIVNSYRRVILLQQPPQFEFFGASIVISLVLIVVGYGYFKRVEWQFADVI